MTILYSVYTAEGLVWAADRMLLNQLANGRFEIHSVIHPKIFRVPGLGDHNRGGLVGYFGQAHVGQQLMATWLPARAATFGGHANVRMFADFVVRRFRLAADAAQRQSPVGFHIGGFERRAGVRVPVFYFARNAELNSLTGDYVRLHSNWGFEIHEQCLTALQAAYAAPNIRQGLRSAIRQSHGIPMWFRNGDVPGFANVIGALEAGIRGMLLQRPGFRVPTSLPRWERLAKLIIDSATETAAIYYAAGPPHVGGRADALTLRWDDY